MWNVRREVFPSHRVKITYPTGSVGFLSSKSLSTIHTRIKDGVLSGFATWHVAHTRAVARLNFMAVESPRDTCQSSHLTVELCDNALCHWFCVDSVACVGARGPHCVLTSFSVPVSPLMAHVSPVCVPPQQHLA